MAMYAAAFFGAVCHLEGCDVKVTVDSPSILSSSKNYCDVNVVKEHYDRNLFDANGGRNNWHVYMHSWNTDLAGTLMDLYSPVKAVFENYTTVYPSFASSGMGVLEQSRAYSQSAALRLLLTNPFNYSRIVILRPDVLLFKPLNLAMHSSSHVYHDSGNQGTSDFFFVVDI